MLNAKEELLKHIMVFDKEVSFISVAIRNSAGNGFLRVQGGVDDVLPFLDVTYDNSYGRQELFGYIWYTDGSWSEREVDDGDEWWEHRACPPRDVNVLS